MTNTEQENFLLKYVMTYEMTSSFYFPNALHKNKYSAAIKLSSKYQQCLIKFNLNPNGWDTLISCHVKRSYVK